MNHETVYVTPAMAHEWLGTNSDNRNISQTYVDKLARDMQHGEFAYVADPVRFDQEGRLIDGQHRLKAITQSNTTQPLLVVRGMDRSDRRFLDRGRKRRVADNLRMDFGIPSATTVAAIARTVIRWEHTALRNSAAYRPSDTEVYDLVVQDSERFVDASVFAMRLRASIGSQPSAAGTAYYLSTERKPQVAYPFWERVEHGEGLLRGDPALTLRNAIVRAASGNMYGATEQHLAMYLRAWRSAARKRTLTRLSLQRMDKITDDMFDLE